MKLKGTDLFYLLLPTAFDAAGSFLLPNFFSGELKFIVFFDRINTRYAKIKKIKISDLFIPYNELVGLSICFMPKNGTSKLFSARRSK
jgi:hypothetical protein